MIKTLNDGEEALIEQLGKLKEERDIMIQHNQEELSDEDHKRLAELDQQIADLEKQFSIN